MTPPQPAQQNKTSFFLRPLAALALAAALAAPCLAGSEFFTDDPVPVDKGKVEIDFASLDTWSRDGVSGTLPHLEFDYGAIDNVELHLLAPMVFNRTNNTGRMDYGYGDTELGAEWRFIQEDGWFKGCPQVSIYPLFELPTGDRNRGLGNGRAQEYIPIWMQKSWGPDNRQWTAFGGGGYEFNPGRGNENFGFFGAVLQKQITDNLTIGGELYHFTPDANGSSGHTGFNLGGTYDFSDNWHLQFAAGRDLWGDNLLTCFTAIQFTN